MKLLQVHNFYQQPGGEEAVVRGEHALLSEAGHQVSTFVRDNDEIASYGIVRKASLSLRTVWAWDSYRKMQAVLSKEQPDVAHFHNVFPLISPAAYYACRKAGVPVVQTLHNYRLLCSSANFFRDGKVCEECVEHSLWRGVRYGCYRQSRAETAIVALSLAAHRAMNTWSEMVDCYIALTEFERRKFIAAGFPPDKLVVKPNFVKPDPGPRNGTSDYALFVGRLSPEKGLRTLLAGWQHLGNHIPLLLVGDGPLRAELEAKACEDGSSNITFCGRLAPARAIEAMKGARFLVFPSEWYEGFPVAIIEAFASGVPVISSRLGSMREIIEDGRTGLHFTHGNAADLAAKVGWAWSHPSEIAGMGKQARREYEAKYTPQANYAMLLEIYGRVLATPTANAEISARSDRSLFEPPLQISQGGQGLNDEPKA
jgi:glycosyltransferase involved in cell wall biosynthesis